MNFTSGRKPTSNQNTTRQIFSLLTLAFFVVIAGCRTTESSEDQPEPPNTLVLAIDGISYYTFSRLQEEGKLPLFKKVSPMVASFPSISDPSWSRMMRVGPPPGYTKEYFDPSRPTPGGEGKEIGSVLSHIDETPVYESGFDHRVEGIIGHMTSLTWLTTSARIWIEELPDHFFRARNRKFFYAFTLNSDLISHTQGEAGVIDFLLRLEHQLERMNTRMKTISSLPFEVVIVSDHGNDFLNPKIVKFEDQMKTLGWSWRPHLNGKSDYAFTAPEIISFGSFYTKIGSEKKFAQDLIRVPGIENTLYTTDPDGDHVRILTEKGNDELEVIMDSTRKKVMLKLIRGKDDLDQLKYFTRGPLDLDAYFELSKKENYPYMAVRAWEGFHKSCKFPGSVLASTLKGFAFGNPTLEILTAIKGLQSMHGSFRREETLGIFASNLRELPTIRPEDFGNWVNLSEYSMNVKK